MENLKQLESLGFVMPSPAYLFGTLVFGVIGLFVYRYGKKMVLPVPKWIGMTLMLYPYIVPQTWALYLVGSGLCLGAYLYRN